MSSALNYLEKKKCKNACLISIIYGRRPSVVYQEPIIHWNSTGALGLSPLQVQSSKLWSNSGPLREKNIFFCTFNAWNESIMTLKETCLCIPLGENIFFCTFNAWNESVMTLKKTCRVKKKEILKKNQGPLKFNMFYDFPDAFSQWQACMLRFWKGKDTWRNCKILPEHFKGTKGNDHGATRQSHSMPSWSTRAGCFTSF